MTGNPPDQFFRFGLIVTGKGEEKGAAELFRSLAATRLCSFSVLKRINQLRPVTSSKRILKMIGTGKNIAGKDVENVGLPARNFIQENSGRFVIVLDDLEWEWRDRATEVFRRYRDALDEVLKNDFKQRASVHFFVMMVEAYFLADANAMNTELGLSLTDRQKDVEEIRNPKAEIKELFPSYNETEHVPKILKRLRIEHILAQPERCACLRALFAWCVKRLREHPCIHHINLPDYHLKDGQISPVTGKQ